MDLQKIRQLAGIKDVENSAFTILETVNFSENPTLEEVTAMFDAARRALSIAHRLTDPMQKKRHFAKILGGMNKIRAYLKKMVDAPVPGQTPGVPPTV